MLRGILEGKETTIAERWIELVCATYPRETAVFLEGDRDAFSNPVGRMLREMAQPLVRALVEDRADPETIENLAELMRLRSVQDMGPAEAVGVAPLLRRAVMDVAGDRVKAAGTAAVEELGIRVERMMMLSFDAFVMSRERLYEIRIAERERHTASLLRRAERVLAGTPETGCGRREGDSAAGC